LETLTAELLAVMNQTMQPTRRRFACGHRSGQAARAVAQRRGRQREGMRASMVLAIAIARLGRVRRTLVRPDPC
jgi:hypothetical protein